MWKTSFIVVIKSRIHNLLGNEEDTSIETCLYIWYDCSFGNFRYTILEPTIIDGRNPVLVILLVALDGGNTLMLLIVFIFVASSWLILPIFINYCKEA